MKLIKDWVRMEHREDWVLLARLVERNLLSVARGLDLAGRFSPGDCLRTLVRFLPYANNDQVAEISHVLVEKARQLEPPRYDDDNASYKRELCIEASKYAINTLLNQRRFALVSRLVSELRDDVVDWHVRSDLVERSLTNPNLDLRSFGSPTDRLLSLADDRGRRVLGRMFAEAPNLVSGLDLKRLPLDMLASVAKGALRQDTRRSALKMMIVEPWATWSQDRNEQIRTLSLLILNGVLKKPSNWSYSRLVWYSPATTLLALVALIESGHIDEVNAYLTGQRGFMRVGLAEALSKSCKRRGLESNAAQAISQAVRDDCMHRYRLWRKENCSSVRRFLHITPSLPDELELCGALFESRDIGPITTRFDWIVKWESHVSGEYAFWAEFLLNCHRDDVVWHQPYDYEMDCLVVSCECNLGFENLVSKCRSAKSTFGVVREVKQEITRTLISQYAASSEEVCSMIVKLATSDLGGPDIYDRNYVYWCFGHLASIGRIDLIRPLLSNVLFLGDISLAYILFENGLDEDAMSFLTSTVFDARAKNARIRPPERSESVDFLISHCAKCASRHGHSDFAAGLLVPWEGWLRWFYEATEEVLPNISAASARRLLETLSAYNEWGLENYPEQRLGEYDSDLHCIMSSLQVRSTEMSLFEISQSPSFWWRKYASMHRAMPYSDDDLVDHAMKMCEYAPIEQLKTLAEIRKWL